MGHGIVKPNLDGSIEKCGGPTICEECAREWAKEYGENLQTDVKIPYPDFGKFITWFMLEYPYIINDHERHTAYLLCKKVWMAAVASKDFEYVV